MTIEKIGEIGRIQYNKVKDIKERAQKSSTKKSDEVEISAEAKDAQSVYHLVSEIANEKPENVEKVKALKKKINDGSYLTDKIVEKVAEEIAKILI